jgi:hypothetical protein
MAQQSIPEITPTAPSDIIEELCGRSTVLAALIEIGKRVYDNDLHAHAMLHVIGLYQAETNDRLSRMFEAEQELAAG